METTSPTTTKKVKTIKKLTKLMDSAFRIPGTGIRFGWDAIIGLIPGAGDVITLLVSLYLFWEISKEGVSKKVVFQMLWNITLDWLVGTIPILGDIFDVGFKANQRNLALLEKHYEKQQNEASTS